MTGLFYGHGNTERFFTVAPNVSPRRPTYVNANRPALALKKWIKERQPDNVDRPFVKCDYDDADFIVSSYYEGCSVKYYKFKL